MPTGADQTLLVDTSVAVPLVVTDHDDHASVIQATAGRRLGLAGHAAFETYSVLTRLPPPLRRTPHAVARVLASNFPASLFLPDTAAAELLARLPALGIAGGGVYDALIGATAAGHGVPLATRDRRALDVYRRLGADVVVI